MNICEQLREDVASTGCRHVCKQIIVVSADETRKQRIYLFRPELFFFFTKPFSGVCGRGPRQLDSRQKRELVGANNKVELLPQQTLESVRGSGK